MKTINIGHGKPTGVGSYIAMAPGSAHPEFVRVRRLGSKMEIYGESWSKMLDDLDGDWQFSERLELVVSSEVETMVSEKDRV